MNDCLNCGKPVEGYEPKYCCTAYDCGCQQKPVNPCICSQECWDAMMSEDCPEEGTKAEGDIQP